MGLGYTTVTTDVEVDVEDVLDDLPVSEILEYLKERKDAGEYTLDFSGNTFEALVKEAYDALMERDFPIAQLRLEQALFPKFKSLEACLSLLPKKHAVS